MVRAEALDRLADTVSEHDLGSDNYASRVFLFSVAKAMLLR